jgi:hypothetical protein
MVALFLEDPVYKHMCAVHLVSTSAIKMAAVGFRDLSCYESGK